MKLFVCLIVGFLFIHVVPVDAREYIKYEGSPHLYISHFENVLGTSLELKISAASKKDAAGAETAALREIDRLAKILSAYDTTSEFSRWFRTFQQPVKISSELFEVLGLFDQWRARSNGALDASAEVINKLWKATAAQQRIPTDAELILAVNEVRQQHWKLDSATRTATHLSNAPLKLNSFVKSYIIKRVADAAMFSAGTEAVVVNIGGDLVVSGNVNEPVAITDPKSDAENELPVGRLLVTNKAVATSGNYRRGEFVRGQWYSHIVDPRTGRPAGNIISATVVAPNATDAGALATAFNVMTTAESAKLASSVPGAEFLIITDKGERVESNGWHALEAPLTRESISFGKNNNFEMLINFEINAQWKFLYKRPYVAIWVEDEKQVPVRTISVWQGKDRYMPELKTWYFKYKGAYASDKNFYSSVTSATRPAGKYTVKWDGKDDKGNFVKPGKYIIKIEASREHGTYRLIRQEITCDDNPKLINLTGNNEIASGSIDYRKK